MAIIYTYPLLTTLQGSDLLLISDTSNNNSTKSVTLADIAAFLGTGGTGTTNRLTRWADGPLGILGDSILAQDIGATQVTVIGNFSGRNAGDAAILGGLLSDFSRKNSDCKYLISCSNLFPPF